MNHTPVTALGKMPTRWRLMATPVLSVMLASAACSFLPIIAQAPLIPPLGLLVLLSWRLIHPDLWPMWIGAALGVFDDLVTGQPLGTSVFLWSVVLLGIEFVEQRIMWRDYWHDWLMAALAVILCIGGGWAFARMGGNTGSILLILPQIFWSALIYPLMVRVIARLDRWRIMA